MNVEDSDISAIDRGKKKVQDSDAKEVPLAVSRAKEKEESSKRDLEKKGENSTGKENKVKREKKEESATTIESLPDDVLHRLLALVPSKNLVQASILSKRWSVMWKTIPYLQFHYDEFSGDDESYELMMNSVNCILLMRNHCAIHTFRYPPVYREDPIRFFTQSSGWISYSLSHKVRVLAVCISTHYSPKIMEPLFNSRNLEELQVEFYSPGIEMESLSLEKLYLPKLKSLYLLKVHLVDASVSLIVNGCPLLTKCIFEDCKLDNLTIRSSTLECLCIKGESWAPDNVLKSIDMPKITELSISEDGFAMRDIILEGMPLLRTAKINLLNDYLCPHNPSKIIEGRGRMIRALTSVQHLELTGPVIPFVLKRELGRHSQFLPKRKKVLQDPLILHDVNNLHVGGFCLVCNFDVLLQILGMCPNIVRLNLVSKADFLCMHDVEEGNSLTGPISPFAKLRWIEFECTELERRLLVHALKLVSSNGLCNVQISMKD